MYTYNWYQWVAFFYIYCFLGWIFESCYVSVRKHRLVNRGFLRIPMLPLYGSGAVMMLWVSLPVRDNLVLVYFSGVVAATILEYITGSIMEQLFKIRYWDYSNQRFQVHGYICLTSSVAWGFLTILMTEVIHEPIALVVSGMNQSIVISCVLLLSVVFASDMYISTRSALALGKSLEAMTKLKSDIEEMQLRLAALREEAAEHIYLAKEEAADRLSSVKSEARLKLASLREETAERANEFINHHPSGELSHLLRQLEEAKAKRLSILHQGGLHRFYRKGLLLGNPGAVSSKFAAALREIREELEAYGRRK